GPRSPREVRSGSVEVGHRGRQRSSQRPRGADPAGYAGIPPRIARASEATRAAGDHTTEDRPPNRPHRTAVETRATRTSTTSPTPRDRSHTRRPRWGGPGGEAPSG